MRSHPGADPTNDRRPSAVTGGYIGFGFGLLAVLSVASEIESPTPGDAALIVLISMIVGYLCGWLLQPVLGQLFKS